MIGPVRTVDYHAAGEPFRIVTSGAPAIPGTTVLERRAAAQTDADIDAVRQLLVREPRGHADMYGCFLVPANDDGAEFGVLFWHKDGYSTACGHGTIALGAWAVNTGLVEAALDGDTDVVMDVPSGRVTARVTRAAGVVQRVAFRNVGSYVVGRDILVATSRGDVRVDVSYGGAIYASLPAADVGLTVHADHYAALISVGREIKWALNASEWARHPVDDRLAGVYGTILYDDLGRGDERSASTQRHRFCGRRGGSFTMRVGHLGTVGTPRRRWTHRSGTGAHPRVDHRHDVPGPGAARGQHRRWRPRGNRDRGYGVRDGRMHVRSRSRRPARNRVRPQIDRCLRPQIDRGGRPNGRPALPARGDRAWRR